MQKSRERAFWAEGTPNAKSRKREQAKCVQEGCHWNRVDKRNRLAMWSGPNRKDSGFYSKRDEGFGGFWSEEYCDLVTFQRDSYPSCCEYVSWAGRQEWKLPEGRLFRYMRYLLLCNKLPQQLATKTDHLCLFSPVLSGSGIQEGRSWVIPAQEVTVRMLTWPVVIRRLDRACRLHLHGGLLTYLSAGGSVSCHVDLSTGLLGCPRNRAADFPWNKWFRKEQGGSHRVGFFFFFFSWPRLVISAIPQGLHSSVLFIVAVNLWRWELLGAVLEAGCCKWCCSSCPRGI